jgi:hypothetical protein
MWMPEFSHPGPHFCRLAVFGIVPLRRASAISTSITGRHRPIRGPTVGISIPGVMQRSVAVRRRPIVGRMLTVAGQTGMAGGVMAGAVEFLGQRRSGDLEQVSNLSCNLGRSDTRLVSSSISRFTDAPREP